jgi:aminopeptidase N
MRSPRAPTLALVAVLALVAIGADALSAPAAIRAAVPSSAIVPGAVGRTSLSLAASYDVSLRLSYGAGRFSAISTMVVTNASGGPIDRLELNTVAARLGRLRIASLSVDGVGVRPKVTDQTILVPLGGVLPDGATTTVRIAFSATVRRTLTGSNWLFTRANGVIQLYRWLPWISRATRFDRPNHGDPVVTVSSPSVRVRITTDRAMRLATSGRRIAVNGLTSTWLAQNVRDFNVAASPSWSSRTTKLGGIAVRVYAFPGGNGRSLMTLALRALRRYQALMGPYPYPTFTVAESAGGSGLESPGLIWIPRGLAYGQLPWLVSHEVAHQWFYALVGNDQARQPFADEAMADFLARYITGTWRSSRCPTATLDRTIYSYSARCYFEIVYVQGGRVLEALRRKMGPSAFWAGIRDYLAANRFGMGGTRLLLDTLDAHTPRDLVGPLRSRFPRIL